MNEIHEGIESRKEWMNKVLTPYMKEAVEEELHKVQILGNRFILLHDAEDMSEFLINTDQISAILPMKLTTGSFISVIDGDGDFISVRESFEDIKRALKFNYRR